MTIPEIIGIVSGFLAFSSYFFYIPAILKGDTKPNRASWWIWGGIGVLIVASYYVLGARGTIWVPISEAIGPVVREIAFPQGEQPGYRGHQVIIHPHPTHGVVDGWEDAHGRMVGIFVGDLVVHVEEVAVPGSYRLLAQPVDGLGEVQVYGQAGGSDPQTLVTDLLGRAGGHVARDERGFLEGDGQGPADQLGGELVAPEAGHDVGPLDLAAQATHHHQYPDGFVLFLGTLFAPTKDRDAPGRGFTHNTGDVVRVSSPRLGLLENKVTSCETAPPWTFGVGALMRNLAGRGLLIGDIVSASCHPIPAVTHQFIIFLVGCRLINVIALPGVHRLLLEIRVVPGVKVTWFLQQIV